MWGIYQNETTFTQWRSSHIKTDRQTDRQPVHLSWNKQCLKCSLAHLSGISLEPNELHYTDSMAWRKEGERVYHGHRGIRLSSAKEPSTLTFSIKRQKYLNEEEGSSCINQSMVYVQCQNLRTNRWKYYIVHKVSVWSFKTFSSETSAASTNHRG